MVSPFANVIVTTIQVIQFSILLGEVHDQKMNVRNHIKARVKPVAQSLLHLALQDRSLTNQMLLDWACRKGWRPSSLGVNEDDYINASFGYDDEADIKRAVSVVRRSTMVSFERLATLWLQIQHIDNHGIAGDLVECGVWRGGAAGMMALAHLHSGLTRAGTYISSTAGKDRVLQVALQHAGRERPRVRAGDVDPEEGALRGRVTPRSV